MNWPLCLPVVKPFVESKSEDEADSSVFPEAILPTYSEYVGTLEESMEQLKQGLESGTVLIQFEVRCHLSVGPFGLNPSFSIKKKTPEEVCHTSRCTAS